MPSLLSSYPIGLFNHFKPYFLPHREGAFINSFTDGLLGGKSIGGNLSFPAPIDSITHAPLSDFLGNSELVAVSIFREGAGRHGFGWKRKKEVWEKKQSTECEWLDK